MLPAHDVYVQCIRVDFFTSTQFYSRVKEENKLRNRVYLSYKAIMGLIE